MQNFKDSIVNLDTSMKDAISKITKSSCQIALVTSANILKGVITDGDIRRAILQGKSLETKSKEIMQKNFVFLNEKKTSKEALRIMRNKNLRQIPQLDKNGRIINLFILNDLIKKNKLENNIVIMAGGKGKRLGKLTKNCPKPMLKVKNKPILEIIIEQCIKFGFENFYFSVNYLRKQIEDYFENGHKWDVNIRYLIEDKPLGTAGSLKLLSINNDKPLIVLNGDVLTKVDFESILQFHKTQSAKVTICVKQNTTKIPYGILEVNEHDVVKLSEKPEFKYYINAGIYVLEPEVLKLIPESSFFDMTDLIQKLKKNKLKVKAFPIYEYWEDLGYPTLLDKANREWM